eukprot:1238747-Alexandrium_andersonii.AAC.1
MELFRVIERKADRIVNPCSYLKKAARREGFGPLPGESSPGPASSCSRTLFFCSDVAARRVDVRALCLCEAGSAVAAVACASPS